MRSLRCGMRKNKTRDKNKDIPVLFRPLYGESTLIKILPQTKARTISYYLWLGQSLIIIYSQVIRASGSQELINHQANARNAQITHEYSLLPGRSDLIMFVIFLFQ